jgi:hypothetical protein
MSLTDQIICNTLTADRILSFSSPVSIFRFARVSKRAYFATQSYIRHTYNINQHLSRFFPDPIAFRSLQARSATLISGSNALQFFDRTFYPESDLDLYVYRRFSSEIGKFLFQAGYEFKPSDRQNKDLDIATRESNPALDTTPYPTTGIRTIFSFSKKKGSGGQEIKIQMVIAG